MTEVFEKKSSLCQRYNDYFDMLKKRGKGEINKHDALRLLLRECLIVEAIEDKGVVSTAEEFVDLKRFTNSMRRRRREDEDSIKHWTDKAFKAWDDIAEQGKEIKKLKTALKQIRSHIDCPEHYSQHINDIIDGAIGPETPVEVK